MKRVIVNDKELDISDSAKDFALSVFGEKSTVKTINGASKIFITETEQLELF